MNRREFVKLCTASVALAALPISLAAKISFDPSEIEWLEDWNDYGFTYGIAGQLTRNGQKRRYAIEFNKSKDELTPEDITNAKHHIIQRFQFDQKLTSP